LSDLSLSFFWFNCLFEESFPSSFLFPLCLLVCCSFSVFLYIF
jgi:hypothetical protein